MRGQDLVGQRAHAREVVRRLDLADSERGHAPGAVLVEEHAHPERLCAGGARDDDLFGDQPVRDV